jgi:hypothetical protein
MMGEDFCYCGGNEAGKPAGGVLQPHVAFCWESDML